MRRYWLLCYCMGPPTAGTAHIETLLADIHSCIIVSCATAIVLDTLLISYIITILLYLVGVVGYC